MTAGGLVDGKIVAQRNGLEGTANLLRVAVLGCNSATTTPRGNAAIHTDRMVLGITYTFQSQLPISPPTRRVYMCSMLLETRRVNRSINACVDG